MVSQLGKVTAVEKLLPSALIGLSPEFLDCRCVHLQFFVRTFRMGLQSQFMDVISLSFYFSKGKYVEKQYGSSIFSINNFSYTALSSMLSGELL